MATTYPASKQTMDSPTGADNLDSPDHATNFNRVADTSEAVQDVIGTTLGTNVLKNFTAGDHAARVSNTSVIQETWSGGTIDTSVLKTPKVNVINEETGASGVTVDGVLHKDNDVIINNNESYQAKQAGGSAKDLIKLNTSDLLVLSQLRHKAESTSSTTENQLIQTGYDTLTGGGARTANTTITFPTAFDSAPDTIITTFRGSGASWPPTTSDKFLSILTDTPTTSNFRVLLFSADAGETLTSATKYWFSWIAIGTKA